VVLAVLWGFTVGCAPVKDGDYHPGVSLELAVESSNGALPGQFQMRTIRSDDLGIQQPLSGPGYAEAVNQSGSGKLYLNGSVMFDFGAETPAEVLLNTAPTLIFGALTGVSDYVVVSSRFPWSYQLVPGGPAVALNNFGLFRRSCPGDDPNLLELVDVRTPIIYDPDLAANDNAGRDVFLERCGHVTLPAEIGDLVAPLSVEPNDGSFFWVTALAFAPTSDAVYVLAGALGNQSVDLFRWNLGALAAVRLARGDFFGPIVLATGGTSALFNDVHINVASNSDGSRFSSDRVTQALTGASQTPLRVPGDAPWPPGAESNATVLSPDGTSLATATHDVSRMPQTHLVDVANRVTAAADLGPGFPLAWAPDGGSLLVQTNEGGYAVLSLNGSIAALAGPLASASTSLSYYRDHRQFFWTVAGAGVIDQGGAGTSVQLFSTQASILMVEANRVPPPVAPLAAVVATSQVFAWAMDCAGVGWTSCNGELRRLSLASGQIDVVARAATAMPFAVSPDGTKLALSDGTNLYLKTLPP
jgi:hypothetical protein